jgi:cytosine/adenosine deaminase-related metal-dependent hydrolase
MNNQVGYAPIESFGSHVLVGTDGIDCDMFEEMRFAFFGARGFGGGLPTGQVLSLLGNNQRLASEVFGVELNTLQPGASADLIVLDYAVPTPLTDENLASHVVFGINSACVESTMTAGRFVIRNRQPSFDATAIRTGAAKAAQKLWDKLQAS